MHLFPINLSLHILQFILWGGYTFAWFQQSYKRGRACCSLYLDSGSVFTINAGLYYIIYIISICLDICIDYQGEFTQSRDMLNKSDIITQQF